MDLAFPEIVAILGALLVVAAAVSGLAHGTVASVSVLAVAAGMGAYATDLVQFSATNPEVVAVIELALIFTLFGDGLTVDRELLRGQARNLGRALFIAMPLSMVVIAVLAKLLFGQLNWAEAFLVGAILAPTDPVITSSIVVAKGVPARLRHILNLESGLNDGLALPVVLVMIAVVAKEGSAQTEAASLLGEAGLGLLLGAAIAWLADKGIHDVRWITFTPKYEGVYALGIGLFAFGLAEATIANGLVATFTAGVVVGITDRDAPETFHRLNESVGAVLQVITFFVFGSLVIEAGLPPEVLAAFAFAALVLFVGRPLPILASFRGSDLPKLQQGFLAWFGPKGVASMLFALFVLKADIPDGELIFQISAVVILASIIAHGLTDTVGARWVERKLDEEAAAAAGADAQPAPG